MRVRGTKNINLGTLQGFVDTAIKRGESTDRIKAIEQILNEYKKIYSGTYSVRGLVRNQKNNEKFTGIIRVNQIFTKDDNETLIRNGVPANVLVIYRGNSKIVLPFDRKLSSVVIPKEIFAELDKLRLSIEIRNKDVLEYNRLELLPEVKQGKTKQLLEKFNNSMKEIDKEQSRFRVERNRLSNLASSDLRTREPSQVRKIFAKFPSKFPDSRFSLPQR